MLLTGDQSIDYPSVHVLSVLSERDDILQSSVLDVLAKAFKSCGYVRPCGPYVPDVKPENLPQHVEKTKPDIVVVVSDYCDITKVKKLPYKKRQFRDLFSSIQKAEGKHFLKLKSLKFRVLCGSFF